MTITMRKIIDDSVQFMANVIVDIDRTYNTVRISDDKGEQADIYMQDHEAGEFITEVSAVWNAVGTCTMEDAALHVAKPYVENCWNDLT